MSKRSSPRVLVIGSGLAGLTTAYLLRREGLEVFVVEKSSTLGFHSASVPIPLDSDGQKSSVASKGHDAAEWIVDVPMRSFQGGYYPLLIALYRHLGIPLKPTHFTFSFSHLHPASDNPGQLFKQRRQSTYFVYAGASGLSLPALPSEALRSTSHLLRAMGRWIAYALCYLLLLFLSFISWHGFPIVKLGLRDLNGVVSLSSRIPFMGWIARSFVLGIIVPLFSAVGTMTTDDVLSIPLPIVLDYVHSTLGTPHYVLGGGLTSRDVARMLIAPIEEQGRGHVKLGVNIVDLRRQEHDGPARDTLEGRMDRGPIVVVLEDGDEIVVDHVVIATQASAATKLVQMLRRRCEGEEKQLDLWLNALDQVEYRSTIVVTHRDQNVLPQPSDIEDINLFTPMTASFPVTNAEAGPSTTGYSRFAASTPTLSSPSSSHTSVSDSEPATPIDAHDDSPLKIPYFCPTSGATYTMGTHVVRAPPHICRKHGKQAAVLQSTNPIMPIDPNTVLAVARLERALPLKAPREFLRTLHQDFTATSSRIHIAGSYAYPGLPLLEGCVGSARRAAEDIMQSWTGDEDRRRTLTESGIGQIDWSTGQGWWPGRLWRWRWASSAVS